MIIKVTQGHIDRGIRGRCKSCPVALALLDATGIPIIVTYSTFFLPLGPTYELPPEVTEFIKRFDNNWTVRPLEFEIPDDTIRAIRDEFERSNSDTSTIIRVGLDSGSQAAAPDTGN